MPIISAVGLSCYEKFEETPNEKVVNTSKLTKPYFKIVGENVIVYLTLLHAKNMNILIDPMLFINKLSSNSSFFMSNL